MVNWVLLIYCNSQSQKILDPVERPYFFIDRINTYLFMTDSLGRKDIKGSAVVRPKLDSNQY